MNTLTDTEKFPRLDPELPHNVSSEVLTNPKLKNSGTFKRLMLRSRDRVIDYPRTAKKPYVDTVKRFVAGKNIVQLRKLIPRYARAAAAIRPAIVEVDRLLESQRGAIHGRLVQLKRQHELALFDANSHRDACINEFNKRRGTCSPATV
jgi:hypothetical protein